MRIEQIFSNGDNTAHALSQVGEPVIPGKVSAHRHLDPARQPQDDLCQDDLVATRVVEVNGLESGSFASKAPMSTP